MASNGEVRVRRDRAQRLRYRPVASIAEAAEWFSKQIQRLLASDPNEWEPLTCLAAQLLVFEAVLTVKDLRSALLASGSAHHVGDLVMLDWQREDGRQDRRELASITASTIGKIPADLAESDVQDALRALETWSGVGLDDLLSAGRAWAFLNLPGWQYAHVTGDAPLAAIPQSAWARKESLLALSDSNRSGHEGDRAQGRVMDRFFIGSISSGGAWLVESILKIITPRMQGASHEAEIREKLQSLNELSDQLEHADRISSLILGWAINLITIGGIRGKRVAPATLKIYLGCSARQIHAALSGKEIERMTEVEFEEIYRKIIERQSSGQRANTATAVNGWHSYLYEMLGISPIRSFANDEPQIPRANIVWPHERERILGWLETATNSRLNQALKTAFSIAFNARVRITELLYLRLRAVHDRGEFFEIHVAPGRGDPPPKSESGRRALTIQDSAAINVLREWVQRRRTENSMPSDYLFGDPYESERLANPGVMTLHLSSVLKAVTGDSSVSFHTLSHTWVSESISNNDWSDFNEINHIEAVSVQAGHRASSTTLSNYFHLYEHPLRNNINEALKEVPVSSLSAGAWSGIRPETLRKRASLSKRDLVSVAWDSLLDGSKSASGLECVSRCFSLSEPVIPHFLASAKPMNFPVLRDVLRVLQDISNGKTVDESACRLDVSPKKVHRLVVLADQLISESQKMWALKNKMDHPGYGGSYVRKFCANHPSALDFSRNNQNKYHSLAKWLESSPAELPSICKAWLRAWKWGYLDLSNAWARDIVLRALHDAAVPPETLAIGFASELSASGMLPIEKLEEQAQCLAAFQCAFATLPAVFSVEERRDRPGIYLIWSSFSITGGNMPAPASSSLAGFHAWIFACTVWTRFIEDQQEKCNEQAI